MLDKLIRQVETLIELEEITKENSEIAERKIYLQGIIHGMETTLLFLKHEKNCKGQ